VDKATEMHIYTVLWIKPKKLVVAATSLEDRKTNFRLITYSGSPTNPENLAKFGSVDFEITGPTEITKIYTVYIINK